MAVVDDLERQISSIAELRPVSDWSDIVKLVAPEMARGFEWTDRGRAGNSMAFDRMSQRSRTSERSSALFDDTAPTLSNRLAAGVESLVSPQSAKWHGLAFDDVFSPEPTQAEDEWFDNLTDYLFAARYEARSGFALANKYHIHSNVKLGTGIYYIEENPDPTDIKKPFYYRPVPLYQAHILCDARGDDIGFFWEMHMTATQALKVYGERVSQKIKDCANNPSRAHEKFWIIHAIFERENGVREATSIKRSRYESVHYERDTKNIVRTSGFYEWPFVISRWHRNGVEPYGIPQAAMVLGTIKTVNSMARDQVTASAQSVRPPLATTGTLERPINSNPGKVNPGLLDEAGNLLVKPLVPFVDPSFAVQTLETYRQQLREAFFGTLWQILLNESGQRTATEVMVRAQEKADMIGPFAANIQAGYARGVEREIAILNRRGAFNAGSPLEAPESLVGKNIGIRLTAPIDKLRRYGDLEAIQLVRMEMLQIAQTHPEVLDNFDPDETWDAVMDIVDAPRRTSFSPEERDRNREAKQQAAMRQMQLQQAGELAKAGKDGAQAAGALNALANAQ